jgi:hypothetical protein
MGMGMGMGMGAPPTWLMAASGCSVCLLTLLVTTHLG